MQQLAIAGLDFDRMAERVAEVEQGAFAELALVAGDHAGLVPAAAGDGLIQCRFIAGQQGIGVLFDPGEERGVADRAVLDHLGQPGQVFAPRQGGRACACR